MQKNIKKHLLLEQLEERIFLDANPIAAVDSVESTADPTVVLIPINPPQVEPQDSGAGEPEPTPETIEQGLDIQLTGAETAEESSSPVQITAEANDAIGLDNTAEITPVTAIDPMIGEDFDFTVSFENTTSSIVYGPYIDLLLDGGEDGNDTGGTGEDGITFQSASYLGANVDATIVDITADGQIIDHPYATDTDGTPLQLTGVNGQTFQEGDQFVSLLMPFGSFTPDQPVAEVQVTAHMGVNADVDTDLGVHTTTGAMFGQDALNHPGTDNPLRDIATSSRAYKAEVIAYNKDIVVQNVAADCQEQHDPTFDDTRQWADDSGQTFEVNHQEIPTGPNFPATYVAAIDIADGQTVSGLSLVDHLPDNIVYSGNVMVEAGGVPVAFTASLSGSDLTITLTNAVNGSGASDDVVISYDFYVPEQTSGSADIIDPDTGDDEHVINDGEVGYSWTSPDNAGENITNATIDPEVDTDGHFSSNADVDDISHAQAIAIQKTMSLRPISAI